MRRKREITEFSQTVRLCPLSFEIYGVLQLEFYSHYRLGVLGRDPNSVQQRRQRHARSLCEIRDLDCVIQWRLARGREHGGRHIGRYASLSGESRDLSFARRASL